IARRPPTSPLFPYTTLFRSDLRERLARLRARDRRIRRQRREAAGANGTQLPRRGLRAKLVQRPSAARGSEVDLRVQLGEARERRSEEHTSELQSQSNLVCRL